MKATGVVRRVDELGRIVLPCELRRTLHINDKDPLEVFVDGDKIILKKYRRMCLLTGSPDDLIEYNDKRVSRQAIKEMAEIAGFLKPENSEDDSNEDDNL